MTENVNLGSIEGDNGERITLVYEPGPCSAHDDRGTVRASTGEVAGWASDAADALRQVRAWYGLPCWAYESPAKAEVWRLIPPPVRRVVGVDWAIGDDYSAALLRDGSIHLFFRRPKP